MAGFTKADRQRIIDGYLTESGANMFVPADFIDWLSERPDHEAYEWFYGQGDETAAREHRIGMARQMANGLRITVKVSTAPAKGTVVNVRVREFPAFVSRMAGRKAGGGYEPFDPSDATAMAELRNQGACAMRSWLARYRGVFEAAGFDLSALEQIGALESGAVALSA